MNQAIAYVWRDVEYADADGEIINTGAMVPAARYRNVAKSQFAAGGEHVLEETAERSRASHGFFFATLNDLFNSIPEKMAPRWPKLDHFRRWCLIETGWFDEKEFEVISEKHAKALGAFIRTNDSFSRISIHGKKVIVRTAKSQSMKAMGKDDFNKSKNDVLDLACQLVGVTRTEAVKHGGRAA